MSAILTTLLGGLLAISGGLAGIALNDRRERTRWLRDAQLQASVNLLSALQLLVRRMINVAYLDPSEWMSQDFLDPKKSKDRDPKSQTFSSPWSRARAGRALPLRSRRAGPGRRARLPCEEGRPAPGATAIPWPGCGELPALGSGSR
jgi:hypothetical protein